MSAPKPDVLFSAIAYRKANAMIQQDKQLQRSMKDAQFRSLESGEKFRVADVRERQLQLILQGFPGSRQHVVVPFVPLTMTDEVLLPLEPLSRQKEREDRKRSEKYNGPLGGAFQKSFEEVLGGAQPPAPRKLRAVGSSKDRVPGRWASILNDIKKY